MSADPFDTKVAEEVRSLTEENRGLRALNAELLAALKRQGMIRSNGEWHLLNCRLGKRRGGLAPESCLGRCVAARAAIAKAEEEA